MSRYVVSYAGLTFAYGFDRPLSEYFLSVSGPGRKIVQFANENGISLSSISCDYTDDGEQILDTDDEVFIHLVGCLSADDTAGNKSNLLDAMWRFKLDEVVPTAHIVAAEMDLPF